MSNQRYFNELDLQRLILNALKEQNVGINFYEDAIISNMPIRPDIYAPDGIPSLGIMGATIIEIKRFLSYSNIDGINAYYDAYGKIFNILVVYYETNLTAFDNVEIPQGYKQLIFKPYSDLAKEDLPTMPGPNGNKPSIDWKQAREEIISQAKQVVNQNCNALFLGAGVSRSAGMPSWDELLKGLLSEAKQLNKDTLQAYSELGSQILDECNNSYLIMGRYLENIIHLYKEDSNFPAIIREHLYNDGKHESDLLSCIVNIVRLKETDEILTYNFDDIVEQRLADKGLKAGKDFTSIYKDAEIGIHNILPIYHVHGILPQKGPVEEVVFSERTFHDRYQDVYHWSNIEQLHALTRKHCFFIGLSMSDPNLRRLLDFARKTNRTNDIPHYAFLQRTELKNFCVADVSNVCKYVHISSSLVDRNKQKEIYDINYDTIDTIFKDMGINVIWYEDFHEIPQLINRVFGLNNESKSIDELISNVQALIDKIKVIEDELNKYQDMKDDPKKLLEGFLYARKHGKEFRNYIDETISILKELYSRIPQTAEAVSLLPLFVPNLNDINGVYSMLKELSDKIQALLKVTNASSNNK